MNEEKGRTQALRLWDLEKEHRVGKFAIDINLLMTFTFDALEKIFSKVIIVKAEKLITEPAKVAGIVYIGFSPFFDKLEKTDLIPSYEAIISRKKITRKSYFTVTWKRMEAKSE